MNKFSKIAAVAALIGVSASASAWWGPGSSTTSFMDEFFGDGAGDFNMNMNTSTRGWGRGYGRGYDYYGYGPYGSLRLPGPLRCRPDGSGRSGAGAGRAVNR